MGGREVGREVPLRPCGSRASLLHANPLQALLPSIAKQLGMHALDYVSIQNQVGPL